MRLEGPVLLPPTVAGVCGGAATAPVLVVGPLLLKLLLELLLFELLSPI